MSVCLVILSICLSASSPLPSQATRARRQAPRPGGLQALRPPSSRVQGTILPMGTELKRGRNITDPPLWRESLVAADEQDRPLVLTQTLSLSLLLFPRWRTSSAWVPPWLCSWPLEGSVQGPVDPRTTSCLAPFARSSSMCSTPPTLW